MKVLAFLALILLIISGAAQCQPTPQPTPQSSTPTPSPRLIPPIQRGDGSDVLDRLLDSGVVRVGVRVWPEGSFSPPAFRGFSNTRIGGALTGFEVDVAHLVADGLGLELELVEAYPPVLASGDWRGQWDIAIASLTPFDQSSSPSSHPLVFSKPYGFMPLGVLIPAATTNIQTFNDLSGKQVGVLVHSAEQQLLTQRRPALTLPQQPLLPQMPAQVQWTPVDNLPKAIRQLGQGNGGSVQAIFAPLPILEEAIKSDVPVKLAPQAERVVTLPLAIAVVPQDNLKVERLIREINKILSRLQRQGALAEIYQRWYEQDLSKAD